MDREGVKEVLREVLGVNVELIDHDKWVSMHCPLSPWTHANGADKTPSAGVSINEDGESIFHCYACGGRNKGPLSWFLKEHEKYTGESHGALLRDIEGNEFLGGALPEWGTRKNKARPLIPLDETIYLDLYDSAVGHPYLRKRGISNRTAELLNLMIDPEDSAGDERILFPVYTPDKKLVGFTGRATSNKVELRVRDYHGLKKEAVLLGSHLVEPSDPVIVLCEGLFDLARLLEYGYSAVAALHAGLTDRQLRVLTNLGLPVLLMFDNDHAGHEATEKAAKLLTPLLPVSAVRYPKRKKDSRGAAWAKDPGGMTMEQVDHLVATARIL